MRRIFLIIILASLVIYGAEFEIKLEGYKDEYIIGEPINICAEVEYKGEGKKTIAKGYNGFKIEIVITDLEGNKIESKIKVESKICLINSFIEIERGWKESKCEELTFGRALNKDEYYVYAYAGSRGPYYRKGKDGNDLIKEDAWEGKIETEKKKIRIVEPEGIDKEAYEYFKGCPFCKKEELLEKYPTSTYAGWVLLHLQNAGSAPIISEKENLIKTANIVASGIRSKKQHPEWDTYKEINGKKIHIKDLYIKNLSYKEKFLLVNPDFLFSSEISSSMGSAYLYWLEDRQKGCYYLELALKLDKWGYNEREAENMKEGAKFYLEELKRLGVCK